jgi:hypothetical protein
MVRPTVPDDVLHVRTADVWIGVVFTKSPNDVKRGGLLGLLLADIATKLVKVRCEIAGSTGRRNTGVKSLCWGFKLQGLTWPFV